MIPRQRGARVTPLAIARTDLAEFLRAAAPGHGVRIMWAIDNLIKAHAAEAALTKPKPRRRARGAKRR